MSIVFVFDNEDIVMKEYLYLLLPIFPVALVVASVLFFAVANRVYATEKKQKDAKEALRLAKLKAHIGEQ